MNDYYSYDKIDETGALYRIAIGERSNGKTYGFKKKCVDNWLQKNKQFALIRRTEEEVKPSLITTYFADMEDYLVEEFKNAYPQYETVVIKAGQGCFRLYGFDSDGIKYELGIMGYYFALSSTIKAKGSQYPNVTIIGFDEFMTNERELKDEFTKFINLISTIIRKRTDVTIYMMGNTVNRRSQLLQGMNINVTKLKQGEISMFYTYHNNGDIANKIAVEYCRHYESPKESEAYFRFDNPKEAMIINGAWEIDEYPLFENEELLSEKIIAGFIFEDSCMRLYAYLTDKKKLYITTERVIKRVNFITLTIGNTYCERRVFNWNCGIAQIEKIKKKIMFLFINGKIKYSSNLVGDDFRHYLLEVNKKGAL